LQETDFPCILALILFAVLIVTENLGVDEILIIEWMLGRRWEGVD